LSPGCIFADSRRLLDSATQMDCRMEFLALWAHYRARLLAQKRFAYPAYNFLFNPETARKYIQQIAAHGAVFGGSLLANADGVLVRKADKQ